MAAGLDEHPVSVVEQSLDGVGETHRLPQVGHPVAGVQLEGVDRGRGDGGVERHVRVERQDAGQEAGDLVGDLVDLGAVGGVVHIDRTGAQPVGLGLGHDGGDLVGWPGDHGGGRSVDRGHHHVGGLTRQQVRRLFPAHAQGGHRPATGQPP